MEGKDSRGVKLEASLAAWNEINYLRQELEGKERRLQESQESADRFERLANANENLYGQEQDTRMDIGRKLSIAQADLKYAEEEIARAYGDCDYNLSVLKTFDFRRQIRQVVCDLVGERKRCKDKGKILEAVTSALKGEG